MLRLGLARELPHAPRCLLRLNRFCSNRTDEDQQAKSFPRRTETYVEEPNDQTIFGVPIPRKISPLILTSEKKIQGDHDIRGQK